MEITDRRGRVLTGSLVVALVLALLAVPSSPAQTQTTCRHVPGVSGGQWTVQTTVTFKPPRTPSRRTCSSVEATAAKDDTSTTPQTTTETKNLYHIEAYSEAPDRITTKARTTDKEYNRYYDFGYTDKDYQRILESGIETTDQTTTEARTTDYEYYRNNIFGLANKDYQRFLGFGTRTYDQTTEEARATDKEYNLYKIFGYADGLYQRILEKGSEKSDETTLEPISTDKEYNLYNISGYTDGDYQNELENETASFASSPAVRSDYTYYAGVGYYKLHQTPKTWLEANETCKEEGGHLAIINSREEESAILKLTSPSIMTHENVYIGFHDRDYEGQFVTVLGDSLESIGYANWATGQPSDSEGDQNCGTVIGTGEINDFFCDETLSFLCELPLL